MLPIRVCKESGKQVGRMGFPSLTLKDINVAVLKKKSKMSIWESVRGRRGYVEAERHDT